MINSHGPLCIVVYSARLQADIFIGFDGVACVSSILQAKSIRNIRSPVGPIADVVTWRIVRSADILPCITIWLVSKLEAIDFVQSNAIDAFLDEGNGVFLVIPRKWKSQNVLGVR